METVLVDQFVVPETAVEEFLKAAHFSAHIVKAHPGFVEGYIFKRKSGEGRVNVVTTAVWESQAAMEAARKSVAEEFEKVGFRPPEIMKSLGVQIERGIYERAPY
jgi:heme-degrading monooxygenase HmoA